MRTPAQPSSTAWRVNFTVSGMAQVPVPGMSCAGETPPSINCSNIDMRSSTPKEFASLVVPNGHSP